MKSATLVIRAAQNHDIRAKAVTISRDIPHGITLCGLRTLVDDLIERVGNDYWYVMNIEVVE